MKENYQNDYQLSFLYNILNRSISKPLPKKEIVSPNVYPPKSISFQNPPKKLIKHRNIKESTNKKLKSNSPIKQQNPKKSNSTVYVFDQYDSFYPAHVPVKYGFQIRSLIENHHLPSWRFSKHDRNQIIYKPPIDRSPSKPINLSFKFPSSTSAIPKRSWSIDTQIQHRWIHSLLNSSSSTEQNRQLSSVVHQCNPSSSIPITVAAQKTPPERLFSTKQYSDKPQLKVKRRPKCATFEEHFQRYYLPRGCLTYSRNLLLRLTN